MIQGAWWITAKLKATKANLLSREGMGLLTSSVGSIWLSKLATSSSAGLTTKLHASEKYLGISRGRDELYTPCRCCA